MITVVGDPEAIGTQSSIPDDDFADAPRSDCSNIEPLEPSAWPPFDPSNIAQIPRLISWSNPNFAADPLYSTEARNIFLKLQNRSLRDETVHPLNSVLLRPPPPPDDMHVQCTDSNQLSFFIHEVPRLIGAYCGTPQMINVLLQSINQPFVRHTIVAFALAVQQTRDSPVPLSVYRNVQSVIPHLQHAINERNLNNAHLISVTFLAWLALTICDFQTARCHLRGFISMLQATHHISMYANPTRYKPSTIAMYLFCIAVKADNYIACRDLNSKMTIPPIRVNETYHRKWIQYITSSELLLQYSLANIQLDGLANNICHLQRQAKNLRLSLSNAQPEISRRVASIKAEHQRWLSRPYIQHHLLANDQRYNVLESLEQPATVRFLDYSRYTIFDPLVALMHMTHAHLAIQMNFILAGSINREDNESYNAAILICRICAALKELLGRNEDRMLYRCITSLLFAGLVFTNSRYSDGT